MASKTILSNRTFDELRVGETASLARSLARDDIDLFAAVSNDVNPTHVDLDFAGDARGLVGHSMWAGALISGVLGSRLPGPGTRYISQTLDFEGSIRVGDTVTAKVTVRDKDAASGQVVLDCLCTNQDGETVARGSARVHAPEEKIERPLGELPQIGLNRHDAYRSLIDSCAGLAPVATAVAFPCDHDSLLGPLEAAEAGLIEPILVGPEAQIRAAAEAGGRDVARFRIEPAADSREAAARAVALVRAGEAQLLMKGNLHTDELMRAVMQRETGLRGGRRISHCFVMAVPTYEGPLIITDAAINIYPTLEDKADICQNAIDLARALDIAEPRVAILSAVETVTPKIQGTLEAAALCKMADRGQITGGLLDGPLAFDNAVSAKAAETKGIRSPVAGRANILLVPDLEAGNMLAKNLSFLANADSAGIVLGARVPIILTSRADSVRARMASCAVAVRYVAAHAGEPAVAAE